VKNAFDAAARTAIKTAEVTAKALLKIGKGK